MDSVRNLTKRSLIYKIHAVSYRQTTVGHFGGLGTPFPHPPKQPSLCLSLFWVFLSPISHPHYLVLHLTLHDCSHSFRNTFLGYISVIILFVMSLVRFELHVLYSEREYQEKKNGLSPKAAFGKVYSVPSCAIIPVGCCACHLSFSAMVSKFVFFIFRLH